MFQRLGLEHVFLGDHYSTHYTHIPGNFARGAAKIHSLHQLGDAVSLEASASFRGMARPVPIILRPGHGRESEVLPW